MNESTTIRITDSSANPAPLGLIGFGLTTILLNLANAGLIPLTSMIMGMGIFVGGIAQVFAGLMEWKKNNTFGTVAFTAYGSFWLALVATWVLPNMGLAEAADPVSMGWFLLFWGLFTAGMFAGTFRLNRALQVVFGTLTLLFFLFALADFTGSHQIKVIAGYEGIVCGLSAVYACLAQVLNEVYGETVLPLGAVKKPKAAKKSAVPAARALATA
ncbi:acetate uptake transporter [Botryobacter ruber]|uniref:acetate uptake transporter n=1 Tax=Botryobacter ruber TaxID=2171629 RepID=UPI000E0A7947|nr:GPR1/FUN34/YaaH family transporter [Botryobacter ruber]